MSPTYPRPADSVWRPSFHEASPARRPDRAPLTRRLRLIAGFSTLIVSLSLLMMPEATSARAAAPVPNAGNTGVPSNVRLTSSGSIKVTRDGTVISGLHVRGTITVEADDVVIRNTKVESDTSVSPILVRAGATGALIENVEVDAQDGTGIGINFKLGADGGTVRSANIYGGEDGIRISAHGTTIERTYVHHLHRHSGGHHDSIQIRAGDNITIRNNNLQIYVPESRDPMNAAIQIGTLVGGNTISNLLVEGNLMNGGNVTINGGGRGEVASARYRNNRFGRDFRYGVSGNLQNSVWESSNVYDDNGRPAR